MNETELSGLPNSIVQIEAIFVHQIHLPRNKWKERAHQGMKQRNRVRKLGSATSGFGQIDRTYRSTIIFRQLWLSQNIREWRETRQVAPKFRQRGPLPRVLDARAHGEGLRRTMLEDHRKHFWDFDGAVHDIWTEELVVA